MIYLNPEFSSLIQSEQHDLYRDGGKSEIIINADIGHIAKFRCQIYLVDGTSCGNDLSLQFDGKTEKRNWSDIDQMIH